MQHSSLTSPKRRKASRKLQIDYRPLGMIFATGMIHSEGCLAPALGKLKHPKSKQNHSRGPDKLTLAKRLRTRVEVEHPSPAAPPRLTSCFVRSCQELRTRSISKGSTCRVVQMHEHRQCFSSFAAPSYLGLLAVGCRESSHG